ncbi:uncharacterized protein LOC111065701 [Drosophila obscura]|uniref:uncharacterized protein LOC111065701 n=1 Tax=Drosophila obscura TaxID=7282 RepID=UPI001BB17784|nr:uncharacterized protein LOC111065701 [Drosophila obscura]
MFPNYCFTKSTKQQGFDIQRRPYMPRDGYPRSGRPSERSAAFSRSGTPRQGMRYADVSGPGPGYQGSVNSKRPKRKLPMSSSIKNMAYKPPSALKPTSSRRNVAFQLPAVVCVSKESVGHTKKHARVPAGEDMVRDRHCKRQANVQVDDPNQELQESFADFFSIIHDNVLETVQGAVQSMVTKCFEESIAKMELLSSEMLRQEKMLHKMFRDINAKIDDQNETNLNQFKFVTQMLIDNQTVHYRALNQAKMDKRRHQAERDSEKERGRERKKKRSTCGSEENDPNMRGPQHQLWQQQNRHIYHTEMCKPYTQDECKTCRPAPPSRPPSRQQSVPRLQNKMPAASMPDLSKRAVSNNGINRAMQPEVQSLKARPNRQSSRQRAPCPVLAYPPTLRSDSTTRRCVKSGSSVEHLE